MKKTYVITESIPSKKNSRVNTKSGRSFPSKAYTQWHQNTEFELVAQKLVKFTKPVRLVAEFRFENNIRRDLDNRLSSVLDLFTDLGIIEDDRWQCVPEIHLIGKLDKENPKTLITLEEIDG